MKELSFEQMECVNGGGLLSGVSLADNWTWLGGICEEEVYMITQFLGGAWQSIVGTNQNAAWHTPGYVREQLGL